MMKRLPEILGIAFIAFIVLVLCQGCAETQADFNQRVEVIDPVTGRVVYKRTTDTGSFARAPSDASAPTTQSVGEGGVTASVSGVHTKTPDQIIAENYKFFYIAGAGFLLAAVIAATLLKSKPLAIGCGIAAGACALTPTFLNEVGPWLLPVGGLGLLGSAVWYMANRQTSVRASKIAGEQAGEAQRLQEQGKLVEALDRMNSAVEAMRVAKPEFAKAVDAAK